VGGERGRERGYSAHPWLKPRLATGFLCIKYPGYDFVIHEPKL